MPWFCIIWLLGGSGRGQNNPPPLIINPPRPPTPSPPCAKGFIIGSAEQFTSDLSASGRWGLLSGPSAKASMPRPCFLLLFVAFHEYGVFFCLYTQCFLTRELDFAAIYNGLWRGLKFLLLFAVVHENGTCICLYTQCFLSRATPAKAGV